MIQRLLPRRRGALILAYHSIGQGENQYTVSPEMFAWQIGEIKRQGLRFISLYELEQMIERGNVEDRTVILTFDDGRRDNYTNMFPVIRKHAVPVTIFSITGLIGKEITEGPRPTAFMKEAEMREMRDSGLVTFEPHSVTHPKFTEISSEVARKEISDSKVALERLLSTTCRYFAYPYGRSSEETRRIAAECGLTLAVSTHAGFVTEHTNRMALPRNDIRGDVGQGQFMSILHRGALR